METENKIKEMQRLISQIECIDLKDITGAEIIGGIEGGRSDSFAMLSIKLKNGKIYHIYGKKNANILVTSKRMFERDLKAVYNLKEG
jgi:hypothetical protein